VGKGLTEIQILPKLRQKIIALLKNIKAQGLKILEPLKFIVLD